MVVPTGYKVTDAGIIPEDWNVEVLGNLVKLTSGESPAKMYFSSVGFPYFKVDQLNNSIKYQKYSPYHVKACNPVSKGSIVFPKRGAAIATNKIRLLAQDSYFDTNIMAATIVSESIYSEYLFYWFIRRNLWEIADTTSVPQINNKHIKPLVLPYPQLSEQTAIAEALSDADRLITSLEKLIAKKKAIKQGAMQELLTGKKRLPGFSGEWIKQSLLDGRKLMQGLTYSPDDVKTHGLLVLRSSNIQNETLSFEDNVFVDCVVDEDQIVKTGDILICVRNGSTALIGKCALIDKNYNATFGAFMSVIRCTDYQYIYHVFRSDLVQQQIRNNSNATINQITKKDFEHITILIPSLEEQTAIASILSDMDAEIEQLEKKLEKYRLIKQGMMQELLTGRIRLIEVESKPQKVPTGHNEKYDDAIAISAIVNAFYDERFYLGRVKVQKLLYLLRRKQEADVSGFKKKAAGPYNEQVRYNGGESIAVREGYVVRKSSKMGSTFSKGKSIETALKYAGSMQEDIEWLHQKFKYYNTNKETNNLEVLATVDMAVREIEMVGKAVTLDAVKDVIRSNKEWAPKLKKAFFTDSAIEQAIKESKELFA